MSSPENHAEWELRFSEKGTDSSHYSHKGWLLIDCMPVVCEGQFIFLHIRKSMGRHTTIQWKASVHLSSPIAWHGIKNTMKGMDRLLNIKNFFFFNKWKNQSKLPFEGFVFKTDFPELVKDDFPTSDTGPWPPTAMFWKSCYFRRYKWQGLSLWSMPPSDQIVCSMSIGPSCWSERPARLCRPHLQRLTFLSLYFPNMHLFFRPQRAQLPTNSEDKLTRGNYLWIINRFGVWAVSVSHFLLSRDHCLASHPLLK